MQTPCKKRITNEIKYIEKNLPFYKISELDNINTINNINNINNINTINKTYIEVITPNNNKLIFELSNNYPFKPPISLLCNGHNYIYVIKKMPFRIKYLYNNPNEMYYDGKSKTINFNNSSCLCCNSLLCPDNWSPICTLYNILDEINEHNKLKNKIMNKLILKTIFDNFNLPLELISIVYKFLH